MTNILEFTSLHGKVAIPTHKILGICEPSPATKVSGFNTFIATGADSPDGGENGFYVNEPYDTVRVMLDSALDE